MSKGEVFPLVSFRGQEYVLVPGIGEDFPYGALTTKDRYETGELSLCHAFPTGEVRRFGDVIGKASEIQRLGEVECNPKPEAMRKMVGALFGRAEDAQA